MIAIDLYTFVMRELSALSDIFKSIPMNLFSYIFARQFTNFCACCVVW